MEMSILRLSAFLENETAWKSTKTLEVDYSFSYRWDLNMILALDNICIRLKVRRLVFCISWGAVEIEKMNSFFRSLESFSYHNETLALPLLKEIVIYYEKDQPTIWQHFIPLSNVTKLTWILPSSKLTKQSFNKMVDHILPIMFDKLVFQSYKIRELDFVYGEEPPRHFNQDKDGFFGWSINGKHVLNFLERNRKIHQKYLAATATFLGVLKFRRNELSRLVGRDVFQIILRMILETRGTKVWVERILNEKR